MVNLLYVLIYIIYEINYDKYFVNEEIEYQRSKVFFLCYKASNCQSQELKLYSLILDLIVLVILFFCIFDKNR